MADQPDPTAERQLEDDYVEAWAEYDEAEDRAIAATVRERLANDDGTRYTMEEICEAVGVDPASLDFG